MNTAQQRIQDAVYRLALEVDSLLVNGLTLGCQIPWSTSKGFVGALVEKCVSALDELGVAEKQSQPLVQQAQEHIQRMGDDILQLVDGKSMPRERVESLAHDIVQEYAEIREVVKSLESSLKVTKPFYETRPVASTKRIDELLRDLPRLFLVDTNPQPATAK